MINDRQYQPLRASDDGVEDGDGANWDANTEIYPPGTRNFVSCILIFLLSLTANVVLVVDNAHLRSSTRHVGMTKYAGLEFDTPITYHSFSEYWNPNISQAASDAAWDALDTNPIAVSLDDEYAKKLGLGPSTGFPWDTQRSIYYIKGFHDLHCLKLIRKAIVSKHNEDDQPFSLDHLFHCLDGLRQDIMCTADDTLMPAAVAHHIGDNQIRQCRSWNKLTDWATRPDQHACHIFDDYREATNTLELFAFCPPDSPYRPIMEAYFEYHGHKDAYEPKVESAEEIF